MVKNIVINGASMYMILNGVIIDAINAAANKIPVIVDII